MDLFLRCRYISMSILSYHPSKMHLLSLTLYVYVCVYLHMYAQYVCYIPYCVYVCTCVCTVHPVSVYIGSTC